MISIKYVLYLNLFCGFVVLFYNRGWFKLNLVFMTNHKVCHKNNLKMVTIINEHSITIYFKFKDAKMYIQAVRSCSK